MLGTVRVGDIFKIKRSALQHFFFEWSLCERMGTFGQICVQTVSSSGPDLSKQTFGQLSTGPGFDSRSRQH